MSLADVVVGDAVMVRSGGSWGAEQPSRKRIVARVLKTQVVLDTGERFTKYGSKMGSGAWSREWAEPWNEETHRRIVDEANRQHMRRTVRAFFEDRKQYDTLSDDQWARIKAICAEPKQATAPLPEPPLAPTGN